MRFTGFTLLIFQLWFTGLAYGEAFDKAWSPAKVTVDGSKLFVSAKNTQMTLHFRRDLQATMPTLEMDKVSVIAAIDAVRSGIQAAMGMGKFRTEHLRFQKLRDGSVQELLSAVYVDSLGRRFYLYEEQIFRDGIAFITQISSPLPIARGLGLVQETRVDFQKLQRGVAAEETVEAAAICVDCLEEKAGFFEKTMRDIGKATDKMTARERGEACAKVKTEKRSMLSGLIGETEYQSWDEQFNSSLSMMARKRSSLNCVAGAGVGAIKGFADPFIMLGKGVWWAAKKTPGAVASLFETKTWNSMYDAVKKTPEAAKSVVAGAAVVGTAALSAARDPIGTATSIASALGRMINSYLVNRVPEFICLTPEAKAEMICGVIGYIAGSLADPLILFKLWKSGQFAKLGEIFGKGYDSLKAKYTREESVSPALTDPRVIEGTFIRIEKATPEEAKVVAKAAEDPKRADPIVQILKEDEARFADDVVPAGGDAIKALSKWKDPATSVFLKQFDEALKSGDEAEIKSAQSFIKILRAEKSSNFREAVQSAIQKFEAKAQQCLVGAAVGADR